MDTFTRRYIEAALWSSTDDNGESLDLYTVDDIAPETLAAMQEDCEAFQSEHADAITEDLGRAGHDFWLTRNRHGAGFLDGDWSKEVGKRLTEASHAYGGAYLYVGDDGLIHGS